MPKKFLKFVCIGDGGCGKTCLLYVYAKGNFPTSNIPTVFDNFSRQVTFNDNTYSVQLWDTAGQEEYDRVRTLSYPGSQLFILCFSVANRDSLENVSEKWFPEIEKFVKSKKVPVILVGLKSDLREDTKLKEEMEKNNKTFVTKEEAEQVAKTLNFSCYIECSAQKNEGVNEVFETCVKVVASQIGKKGECIIS